MKRTHPLTTATAAALLLAVAGCGSDEPTDTDAGGHDMSGMSDHAGMMNDPDATPADQLEDADVTQGSFTALDTAPPGTDNTSGTAWLAQNDDGTTVTLRLDGLEPGADYIAHLHEQTCANDAGGDHFAFDPDGPETPPNEVHLMLEADENGQAEATVSNDRRVGDEARSVVIHPVATPDNRVACADF